MNLINISPNIFINPEYISCIEQKIVNKNTIIVVWVDVKSYVVTMKLEELLGILDNLGISTNVSQIKTVQEFAG